jgi:hypothetical protein
MPADEQGGEDLIEHFILTDNDLANLTENSVTHRLKTFNAPFQFYRIQIHRSERGHCSFSFLGILEL